MINNPNSDSLFKSQYYWMNLPGTLSVSNGILTLTGEWIDMYRLNHAYIQLYLKSGSGTSIDSAVCLLHINYVIASGVPSWGATHVCGLHGGNRRYFVEFTHSLFID